LEANVKDGPSSYLLQEVRDAEPTAKVAKPIKNSLFIIFQVLTNLSKGLNIRNILTIFVS
jgi:hypothetical protein